MSDNYYTQASNFVSSISDDVDPRTRLFGFQHSLGAITGNKGMGPEFDFSLQYSPTTAEDNYHLGIGVLIGMSTYDKNNGILSLSSGGCFKVNESSGHPEIQQMKLITFNFYKLDENNYRIIERSGNATDLHDYGDGLCRPINIYSPLGNRLVFNWVSSNYGRVLSSITDDDNEVLCQLEHSSAQVNVTFLPDCDESYTITLATTNDYLTSLRSSALPQGAKWTLSYEDVGMGGGLLTLYKIITPTGLIKSVIYNSGSNIGLMLFPKEANLPPLPAVTHFSIDPGFDQPAMEISYSPDEAGSGFRNYLAYDANLGSGWSPDSDNLYGILDGDYVYKTVTTQECEGSNPLITTYTYNNYHLLLSTQKDQGDTTLLTEVEYYAKTNADYDRQPAQFQYPKQQMTTWIDNSNIKAPQSCFEITSFSYDESGNKLQQISPDGTTTNYEYYPPEGEKDSTNGYTGCPADPENFTRLLRREEVIPASSDFNDEPRKIAYYRYESIAGVNKDLTRDCILPVQQTHCSKSVGTGIETLLLTHVGTYIDSDPASLFYGRVYTLTATTFDSLGKSYPMTQTHSYSYAAGAITQSKGLKTYDGLNDVTQNTRSCFTDQLFTTIDSLGNQEDFKYDPLGRLRQRIRNTGTEYQFIDYIEYTMTLKSGVVQSIYSTHSDDKNNANRIYFDGMGRPISYEQRAEDSEEWYVTETRDYDALGRFKKQVLNDYTGSDPLTSLISIQADMYFDDWGQNCLTEYSSGQREYHSYSPVLRQSLTKLQNKDDSAVIGYQVTQYSIMNLACEINTYKYSGELYSQVLFKHDGLGRLRVRTDEIGHKAFYSYDEFDRVKTQTLPDNSVITKSYDPSSPETWIKSLDILDADNNKTYTLGSRVFDGLGRVKSSSCGGRDLGCTYTSSSRVPDSTTDAMNSTLKYEYIPAFDNAVLSITGDAITHKFEYYDDWGLMKNARKETGSVRDISWFPSGRMDVEKFTLPDGSIRSASYTWTLLGMPLTYVDVNNNTQTLIYDDFGRPWILDDSLLTITSGYDTAGRLTSQFMEAKTGGASLLITLTLDDFGREKRRDFNTSQNDCFTLEQSYNKNNQLQSRAFYKGDEILCKEEFTLYDCRNRLKDYVCSGSQLPVDSAGIPISAQVFFYDVLNNITSCTTTYFDGRVDTAGYLFENPNDPTQLTNDPTQLTNDPTQLTTITHTLTESYPASTAVLYDPNGRMTQDELGRILTYDELGSLINIQSEDGAGEYSYDAMGYLITQSLNNEARELYYHGNRLVNSISSENKQCYRLIYNSAVSDEVLSD